MCTGQRPLGYTFQETDLWWSIQSLCIFIEFSQWPHEIGIIIIIICTDGCGNWGTEKLLHLVSKNTGIPSQAVWLRAYFVNYLKLLPATSVTHCNVQEVAEVDGDIRFWRTFYSMLMSSLSTSRMGGWDLLSCQLKAHFPATSAFWLKSWAKHPDDITALGDGTLYHLPGVINGCLSVRQMFETLGLAKINANVPNAAASGVFLEHFVSLPPRMVNFEQRKVLLLLEQTNHFN